MSWNDTLIKKKKSDNGKAVSTNSCTENSKIVDHVYRSTFLTIQKTERTEY